MTIDSTNNRRHLLLLAGCLIILPIIPLLLGADGDERSRKQRNRREVEQMTPAQRARLDRNYGTFRSMSDQQRKRYRDMHRRLLEAPDGAALRETMAKYHIWLETLSPFQREELRQAADIVSRIELVRRFKAEQSSPAPLSEEDPRLSREDLAAMMKVIARKLSLPQEKLDSMPELTQNLHILATLIRTRRGDLQKGRWSSLFDDKLIDEMIAALPPGKFRTAITAIGNIPFVKSKREIVVRNIFEHLRKDVSQEFESQQPTTDDLARTQERMNPDDRRRYDRLQSPDEQHQFLVSRYQRMQTFQFLKAYPELRSFFFLASFSRGRNGSRRSYPPRIDNRNKEHDSPNRPPRPFPRSGRLERFPPNERPGPKRPK